MIVQILPAEKKDIPEIQDLANKIWLAHYPQIIGHEQIEYMLELFYSSEALAQQIADGQIFYFILCDNEHVGFLAISEKEAGHYFIHKFYIDVSLHGRGIGQAAFAELLKIYPGATAFSLQVNRQNYKPINLYFKLGFVIEKVADFDIGNGYFMNDFVMVKKM